MNKLKKHLEGQYSFNDEDDEDESKCEEAENDATSDESGSEDGAVTEVEEKKLLDKTASSASSAANSAVLTFSAVVLVTGPKRHTQVSDDGDDDIPCAPAVPLKQKGVSPKSSAKKVSELTSNKTQPPSTSPSLAPVVQVKETPYRRVNSLENPLVNSKAQLFGVDDTNAEDMIPATSEQQSSSMENKAKEPERQRASFIQLSSGLNITQESSGRVDGHIEKARKELSDIEVPRTQTEHERNDSAKPLMAPQKQRTKMLKSADFVSQEIRGAQDDISKRIEEEHRKFLSAQAPGGMSLTAKQVSINKEIQLKGEAQHSFSIHGTRPISTSELSSSRKRPPALHPIPITTKKARIHSPHTTSQSATACSLASILATSPGFPSSPPSRPYFCSSKPKPSFTSSPPSRPQLPSSKPALALTSSPLYAPKPHRTIGPLPPSIAQLKPRSRSKPRALPPLKPPPPLKGVQITSINSDSDSESGSNIIEPYKPVSPQEQSLGVLYVSKGNRKATLEGEERKSQQQQSAQPQTDIYAGFRPRSIAVPGYEKLSDNQRRELEERRRKFFGTHREVERFIVTPWTGDRGVAVTAEKRSRWSGGGDLWWMEDDTPMRRFVTRFRGLKAVRRERGDDV
ncbi:hypothetical protein BDD12DRAFT_460318 [Trichophaea hybrida]|nr:hypothetical protein BDD12DRAFT_460318 [Trichophaea hybrida]